MSVEAAKGIAGESTMAEVLEGFPGAQRALFRKYHIGGCASCGFSPNETLAHLCSRNGNLEVREVIAEIERSHQADLKILVEPRELTAWRSEGVPMRLLDIR